MSGCVLLLSLLWSLMEVHSQTFPYVSFMGQTLANHSYVNFSLAGDNVSGNNSVRCRTDLTTCCSGTEGSHRGDWYFPNGTRLPFPGNHIYADAFEQRGNQSVDIRHRNRITSPNGIYRCDIETTAVHDNQVREKVYVGLYTRGGKSSFSVSSEFGGYH